MGNYYGKIGNIPTLSEKANGLIQLCGTEWTTIMNTIRRGRYYNRQEDLDYANDLILPYLVDYGLWDGEKGEPIDRDVCSELWNYIRIITEETKIF